ncbi:alpha-amylase [Flavobacterium noncentrifugens]|uniref:Glycosidase n=1 Tax=Flavobacterium noncentrifugens TaxID=1128970 RepID=A0A1G8ZQI7_9FLAO|nr:alpha-amylase family glycosyl hydrolase [Flavobacterium noncentrifugens]GEP51871.1 alpha-amylase [Flavobacterium noncentrifugens]SDK17307.1 Glycosidase [Flavobacterium noncentrifugens]
MKSYLYLALALLVPFAMTSCSDDDNGAPKAVAPYEQYGTAFTNMPNSQDAVIYQVNIRAFSQNGNLQGVTDRLSQIQELGANVIYLMPVYPVGILNNAGGLGSPYAVKDYKAVNTEFGTLQDLRTLVEEAHKKNMAVILDWVANHTAWDNQWITDHPDWYAKNDAGNIISPPGTNFNDVAQLNYDNQDMRNAMIDAMSYWVYNANIDGFRCDFADNVPQNFWSDAITKIRSIKNQNLIMFAEGTRQNHFAVGFDYTFGFAYFSALKKKFLENLPATTIQDANAAEYATNYNESRRIVRYTTNHDVNVTDGTPLELFGGLKGSIATFVVAAYMKSIPMIYNGQEIGYASRIPFFTHTPIDWTTANADVLAQYKKIIAFRSSSNAVKTGAYTGYSSTKISAFTMEKGSEKVLVLSNLSAGTTNFIAPASLSGIAWKDAFTGESFALSTDITLSPYQYIILKN